MNPSPVIAVNRASRQVTLRHPQALDCIVSRKRVVRIEKNAQGGLSQSAGAPTLGGMGVMRSEDEADFEYDELGPAKLVFVGEPYMQQDMIERDNGAVPMSQVEALIESVANPGAPEDKPQYFLVDSGDLVVLTIGMGLTMAFEVVTVPSMINVYPYARKLVLNPRDDLTYVSPMDGE